MTTRQSPRGALAEGSRAGKQLLCDRYADGRASVCPTVPSVTPNMRRDGAKTSKYPQRACFMTLPEVTTTFVTSEVKLYLAVPSPRSSRCPPARPITSPSSVLRPVSFRARHRTALRSGLRSETSSIIGLAQGRVPNTGLRWPGPSFGTSNAHRDGRPQVPRWGEPGSGRSAPPDRIACRRRSWSRAEPGLGVDPKVPALTPPRSFSRSRAWPRRRPASYTASWLPTRVPRI